MSRYSEISDPALRTQLEADDAAEERGMHSDDRKTCWTHKDYVENCGGDQIEHRDTYYPITLGK
jgi:hypothetical protein